MLETQRQIHPLSRELQFWETNTINLARVQINKIDSKIDKSIQKIKKKSTPSLLFIQTTPNYRSSFRGCLELHGLHRHINIECEMAPQWNPSGNQKTLIGTVMSSSIYIMEGIEIQIRPIGTCYLSKKDKKWKQKGENWGDRDCESRLFVIDISFIISVLCSTVSGVTRIIAFRIIMKVTIYNQPNRKEWFENSYHK